MITPQIPFNRNAVEPVQCIKAGWELIKDQYWLFVGMSVVGLMIGSAVPLGILLGPMMCGLYIAFFKRRRGESFEFATLFKGFDYFGPSIVATLLHMLPILAIVIPCYFLFYISVFVSVAVQGEDPNPAAFFGVMGLFMIFIVAIMIIIVIISIGFTFAYPLIVDRRLQGFDAVKVSFKAAMANFWRLLGMSLLSGLLSIGGMLLCYVGMFLVLPLVYASVAAAYEQVFGLARPEDILSDLPPPPPTFT